MPHPNPLLTFQQMLANLKARPDWQALPDIRIAMWPHQVSFCDDISDERFFNEQYIESRLFAGKAAFVLYLLCGARLASLVCFAYDAWLSHSAGSTLYSFLSKSWILLTFAAFTGVLAIALLKLEPICVRFNRQAQVVHIYKGRKSVATVAWRDVHPFTEFSPSADGKFAINLVFQTGPTAVTMASGAFDIGDESAFVDNLTRLEFLRRYMAEGLCAIQPDPARTPYRPSGFSKAVTFKEDGLLTYLFEILLVKPAYYLAGGPLTDRHLVRRTANVEWPEEVERLCSPGADVTGYDATPVQASRDVFYRFNGRGFDLVNLQGEVIG